MARLSLLLKVMRQLLLMAMLSLPLMATRRNPPMAMQLLPAKVKVPEMKEQGVSARLLQALQCDRFHLKPRAPHSPLRAQLPPLP
mmetsp:Transcript_4465/g.18467  ORF Transcript_4465/g.18467 Transcript_4465/m.18467 type:complete len:85 (-) Transcript_4465:11339-11593(-)